MFVRLLVPINICTLFFPHTINLWNNLPDFVVHSESLVIFKHSPQLYHCFNTVDVALAVRYFMHPCFYA